MNKHKISIQDVVYALDNSVYAAFRNARYLNKIIAEDNFASGELAYHIDNSIVRNCKQTINTLLSLL